MEARTRRIRQSSRPQRHRVLIVADTHCPGPRRCVQRLDPRFVASMEALVVAPAHGTGGWVVDETAVLADARRRLETCTQCLGGAGTWLTPTTRVGDSDPVQAIADALAGFAAEEVLLVTPPTRHSWRRRSVIERARRAFPIHIEHIVAGSSGGTEPSREEGPDDRH